MTTVNSFFAIILRTRLQTNIVA